MADKSHKKHKDKTARDKSARDSKTIKSDSPHAGRENKEHDKERSNHKDHKDNILRRTDSDLNSSIPDLVSPRESKREKKHKENRDKDKDHHKDKEKGREHRDKEHKKAVSPRRHPTESITVQQREQEHVINVTNKDDDYSEVTVSNYYAPNGHNTAPALDGFIVQSTDQSSPRNGNGTTQVLTIPIPGIKRVDSDSDVYTSQVNSPLVSSGKSLHSSSSPPGLLSLASSGAESEPGRALPEIEWKELVLDLENVLGTGAFGIVYKAKWRGATVAVKQLKGIDAENLEHFKREARIMHKIGNHPNIVRLCGICTEPGLYAIVTPCYNHGSVHDQIVKNKVKLDWHQIVKIARDAAAGVYHLHCERFIHRDIAARNVLLDDQWNAMVSDFSLSRILSPGMAGHKTVSAFGPIKWMPPEALLQQHYSSKSDAYSFGIFLWELLYREDPYNGLKAIEVIPRVLKGERPVITESCDPVFKQLMEQCWLEDPEKRPSFRHIVDTLDNYYEELLHHMSRNTSASTQGTASPVTSASNSNGSVNSLHS
jgi:serine/threonine-protein kinase CTR1